MDDQNTIKNTDGITEENKPTEKRVNVEWQAHLAGLQAKKEAASQQGQEADILIMAATDDFEIAGRHVPAMDALSLMLFNKVAAMVKKQGWGFLSETAFSLMALPWLVLTPDEANQAMEADDPSLAKTQIWALAKKGIPLQTLKKFNHWINRQLRSLHEEDTTAPK